MVKIFLHRHLSNSMSEEEEIYETFMRAVSQTTESNKEYEFNESAPRIVYRNTIHRIERFSLEDLYLTIYSFRDTDFVHNTNFADGFLMKALDNDNLDVFIYVYEKHVKLKQWIDESRDNYERFIIYVVKQQPTPLSILKYIYSLFSDRYENPFYVEDIFFKMFRCGSEKTIQFLLDIGVTVDKNTLDLDGLQTNIRKDFFQQLINHNPENMDYFATHIHEFISCDDYDMFIKLFHNYPETYSDNWIPVCLETSAYKILDYLLTALNKELEQEDIDAIFFNIYTDKSIKESAKIILTNYVESGRWVPSPDICRRIIFMGHDCKIVQDVMRFMHQSGEEWLNTLVDFVCLIDLFSREMMCNCYGAMIDKIKNSEDYDYRDPDENLQYRILSKILEKFIEKRDRMGRSSESHVSSHHSSVSEVVRELFIMATENSVHDTDWKFQMRAIINLGVKILPDADFMIPHIIRVIDHTFTSSPDLTDIRNCIFFLIFLSEYRCIIFENADGFDDTLRELMDSSQTISYEDLRNYFVEVSAKLLHYSRKSQLEK